jgi:hypothetical protein
LREELGRRHAFGMQGFSFLSANGPFAVRRRELVGFVLLCQRSERQNVPFLALLNMRHEIVSMEPLHHDNDGTPIQAVESAAQSVVVPSIHSFTARVRSRFIRLERIVNNDDVGSATGEHSTDRR